VNLQPVIHVPGRNLSNRKSPRDGRGDFAFACIRTLYDLIARRNHHGDGILAAVAQADRPDRQPLFFRNSFCRTMQNEIRFSAPFVQGLDLPPGDWTDASSQRFGGCFLGGKVDGQCFGPSAAFKNLQFRKDAFQEAPTMTIKRGLDARNFDDVNSSF